MFKALKEFFLGKEQQKVEQSAPVQDLADIALAQKEVQPVAEVKADPVAVALDLEPMAIAATPAEPAKKPRKPRAPKAEKPAKEKAAKPAKEKAAKPKKAAAMTATAPKKTRSKKA